MTTNKAHKHAVRVRMPKTGESYTSARSQLQAPASLPPREAEPEVSDEAVRRGTGRGWDDWFRILDERGSADFSHRDTAAWLTATQEVSGWWAQSITVGYERARGLRKPHQTAQGFEVSVSKTYPVAVDVLWSAITDERARSAWLGPDVLRERTTNAPRNARFDFGADSSRVLASLEPRGETKSTLFIAHSRLAGPDGVEAMRAYWRERLSELSQRLEKSSQRSPAER